MVDTMMTVAPRPQNVHEHYHAHVYFDAATVVLARSLRTTAAEDLDVKVGRFHEKPGGPHPCGDSFCMPPGRQSGQTSVGKCLRGGRGSSQPARLVRQRF